MRDCGKYAVFLLFYPSALLLLFVDREIGDLFGRRCGFFVISVCKLG